MGNLNCLKTSICKKKINDTFLINKLIQKRKEVLSQKRKEKKHIIKKKYSESEETSQLVLSLSDINIKNDLDDLELKFFENTNDEQSLVNYLDELLKNNKSEFDYNLLLYFNVLSTKNKVKFTGVNKFVSSLEKFQLLIDDIYNKKDKIDIDDITAKINCKDISDRYILFENKIININENNVNLNKLFYENKEEFYQELEKIISQKINSRVTLDNKEVYFQSLINYYYHHFLYGQKKTLFDFNFMYPIIKRYLNEIKKKINFLKKKKIYF